MLRGDLSHLRRGGSSSSSRAGSFRGSWRGNSRGNGRHGKDRIPIKVNDEMPLGNLVAEFKVGDITSSAMPTAEARITDCKYTASYSLNDDKPFKVIVPGRPASWKPPSLPCQLPGDHGDYLRDQNGARFPDHPIQPTIQALFALNENFDPSNIDLLGCASTLGDLLRFVRSIESTFRFDIEVVGNTLFLIRNNKSDVIPNVRGYGHSFLDAFTSPDPDDGVIKSHQRVVSYNFSGLKCLVRFECDAYLLSCAGRDTLVTEPQFNLRPPLLDSIDLQRAGMVVPQGSVAEIKTKSQAVGVIQKGDHLPRLWVRQIPYFITAYHSQGTFQDVQVTNVRQELVEWETEHQDELKRLASILRSLITEAKRRTKRGDGAGAANFLAGSLGRQAGTDSRYWTFGQWG
ncbi:hypothetical protein ONZ43_g1056 [Nemania bipapillata]|uniref:Uncharacterized protein n=1 Tax=Nemania bipapillata TaxID=110536 RepID=A0ACC2J643_9PEZI|nr:hypothetical protein ONZ43_g1056 [Nemania bipapillata]